MGGNCLVIGYGSIGQRHRLNLERLGYSVGIVSARTDVPEGIRQFEDITDAIEDLQPLYVVIANETFRHEPALRAIRDAEFEGPVLVEKPLFSDVADISLTGTFVGYQLRFNPLMLRLRELLAGKRLFSIQAYVGQYLPSWRPGTSITDSYSYSREQGGGALRDLSHELDYLTWIAGRWTRLTANGGTFGDLGVRSDDVFSVLWCAEHCPVVSLEMNYLDRINQRYLNVNAEGLSVRVDLVANVLTTSNGAEPIQVDRNETFVRMHNAILAGKFENVCSGEEGLRIVRMIRAIEKASERLEWIRNENGA